MRVLVFPLDEPGTTTVSARPLGGLSGRDGLEERELVEVEDREDVKIVCPLPGCSLTPA